MKYRAMRLICMFDLPSVKFEDRKRYAVFRKSLIKDGFFMMQESVYCKFCLNKSVVDSAIAKVRSYAPKQGIVQLLCMTEKQYASIVLVIGEDPDCSYGDERIIFL